MKINVLPQMSKGIGPSSVLVLLCLTFVCPRTSFSDLVPPFTIDNSILFWELSMVNGGAFGRARGRSASGSFGASVADGRRPDFIEILCAGGAAAAYRHVPVAESPKVDGSGVRSDVELSMVNGVEVARRVRHPGPGR